MVYPTAHSKLVNIPTTNGLSNSILLPSPTLSPLVYAMCDGLRRCYRKAALFRGPATLCCQRSRKALCVHSHHMHRTQVYNVSAQEPMYTMSLLLCPLSFGTPVPKDHVHCSNSRQQSTKKQNNKFGRRVLKIQAVCNSDSEPKTALRWYSSTSSLARCYYRTYCHY